MLDYMCSGPLNLLSVKRNLGFCFGGVLVCELCSKICSLLRTYEHTVAGTVSSIATCIVKKLVFAVYVGV